MFTLHSSRGEISETDTLAGAMLAAYTHVTEDEGPVRIDRDGANIGSCRLKEHISQGGGAFVIDKVVQLILKEDLC